MLRPKVAEEREYMAVSITPLKPLQLTAKLQESPPPVFLSTNPSHVSPNRLQNLYSVCSHSTNRFPGPNNDAIDLKKLRVAVSNSDVVVSVFLHPDVVSYYASRREGERGGIGSYDWLRRVGRVVGNESGELVGFGRAVSDCGLTASIYDVMVLPPLQGMGIGQMIVKRILRVLTSRGIYDISALCSEEERFFFTACGFGNDILESTTMIYTRTASPGEEVHRVGRKQLLVPPDKKNFK